MKIFRLLLIAAMLVIGGANASAARQNVSEIKGTVLDKATGEPLGWTTVALMRPTVRWPPAPLAMTRERIPFRPRQVNIL
uniref:hypothetical protein n=1 Tax=Candidatus Cryptobacteroides bacterium TaxID=3085639 RepID=UPI0040267045